MTSPLKPPAHETPLESFDRFIKAGNRRDALRAVLYQLALNPADYASRELAARLLCTSEAAKDRADARDLLEEGLTDRTKGLSFTGLIELLQLYFTVGPVDKILPIVTKYRDKLEAAAGRDEVAHWLGHASADVEISNGKFRRARYPSHEAFNGDLRILYLSQIANAFGELRIRKTDKIFTLGSCFAHRIADVLRERGMDTNHLEVSETVNTTFANRSLFEFLMGAQDCAEFWREELDRRKQEPATILGRLKEAAAVIYTLGVCPAFFDRTTGAFVPHSVSTLKTRDFAQSNIYRMTTVEENVSNMGAILDMLSRLAPAAKVVITLSPVPLSATFESDSAVVSDCISKSTLRVAAAEICALRNVLYWPSFEMIKWVSPHRAPFFGGDDGNSAHISDEIVRAVVDAFITKCLE